LTRSASWSSIGRSFANLDYESVTSASAGWAGSLFVLALLLLVGMQSLFLKESETCRGCANQRTAIRRGRLHESAIVVPAH
jgi:hypothetical protein